MRRVEDVLGKGWENHVEGQRLKADGDSFRQKLNTQELFDEWSKKVGTLWHVKTLIIFLTKQGMLRGVTQVISHPTFSKSKVLSFFDFLSVIFFKKVVYSFGNKFHVPCVFVIKLLHPPPPSQNPGSALAVCTTLIQRKETGFCNLFLHAPKFEAR